MAPRRPRPRPNARVQGLICPAPSLPGLIISRAGPCD